MATATNHLTEEEISNILLLYPKYGCTLTSLVLGISKKSIIAHTKTLSNPPRDEVNKRLVQLIVQEEFE